MRLSNPLLPKKQQPSTKGATSMDETIINFRTKNWVKKEFFKLCKDQNTNATSLLNTYMREVLTENGVTIPSPTKSVETNEQVSADWRDELVTRSF